MTDSKDSHDRQRVILVTGSSGLIGGELVPYLESQGYAVRGLSRNPEGEGVFHWDPANLKIDAGALEGVDGIIHLAGEGIANGRWTEERKKRILDSRVQGTRTLVEGMRRMPQPPAVLISSSGTNFYAFGPGLKDEHSPSGDSFLAEVCRKWEGEARAAEEFGVRTVQLRTGVVLHPSGGALAKMLPPFRAGMGGPIGSGKQGFPWIAMGDLVRVMEYCLSNREISGPVNAVHPDRVDQEAFSKTLGRVLGRPVVVPLPKTAVKLLFGQMGEETLLADLNVVPGVLQDHGYRFIYPDLHEALASMLD